jgi:hypothetical protein
MGTTRHGCSEHTRHGCSEHQCKEGRRRASTRARGNSTGTKRAVKGLTNEFIRTECREVHTRSMHKECIRRTRVQGSAHEEYA